MPKNRWDRLIQDSHYYTLLYHFPSFSIFLANHYDFDEFFFPFSRPSSFSPRSRKDEYNRVKAAGGKVLDFDGKLKAGGGVGCLVVVGFFV